MKESRRQEGRRRKKENRRKVRKTERKVRLYCGSFSER
jgi:hypothetical protein